MKRPPAYLREVVEFVESNLQDSPRIALALAALLTDDSATNNKSGIGSDLKTFIGQWLLTDPQAIKLLADPGFPVQRALIDGTWVPSWKQARRSKNPGSFEYEVCISFAGKDRAIAEGIARSMTMDSELNRKVFYDEFEKAELWGENLFNHLHEVYSEKSMFCVILFSHAYLQRAWTRLELRAAQTRTLDERSAYVLPVAVDSGAVPPEFASIGYWPYREGDEVEALPKAIEEKISGFIGSNYMTVEEIAESLKHGWIQRAFLDAFQSAMASDRFDRSALVAAALAFTWDSSTETSPDITALLRLVLFSPGPVSELFTEDRLDLEDGYSIMRTYRGRELFYFSKNWAERIKRYFPTDWDFGDDDSAEA